MRSIISTLLLIFSFSGLAQISFNTGSAELDADLNIINKEAKTDLGLFKANLSTDFNISTKKLDYMLSINMEPGEVFLALELSNITNKPVDEVVKVYKSNKDKGWGYIAKQLGIKPGSPEFHELKGNSKNKSSKGNSSSKGNKGKGNKGKSNGKGNKGKGKK